MTAKSPETGPLETFVRLRRGFIPRTVSIALTARLDGADPEAASHAFEVFTRGVDAWLCRGEKVRLISATVHADAAAGLFVETWEAAFPRMSPNAFAMFARMAAASVPGAKRMEIREHGDERALCVRGFESEGEATILDVPWRIAFVPAMESAVRVVFTEPIAPATAEEIAEVLTAWAAVLTLGGFSGAHGEPASTGTVITSVDATAERELVLRFERIACGYDAWEALFEALSPVSEQASIELVEVRGGKSEQTD